MDNSSENFDDLAYELWLFDLYSRLIIIRRKWNTDLTYHYARCLNTETVTIEFDIHIPTNHTNLIVHNRIIIDKNGVSTCTTDARCHQQERIMDIDIKDPECINVVIGKIKSIVDNYDKIVILRKQMHDIFNNISG